MKNVLALFLIPISANAFELEGKWMKDKERTLSFNDEHTIQTPLSRTLYACSNETIHFKNGVASVKIEDYSCTFNGKTAVIEGHDIEWEYQVVGVGKGTIVLKTISSDDEVFYVCTI